MSYSDLDAKLRTKAGKPADSRKLANNTYGVRKDNGDIAVRLHNTDVVTWHPDETVTLNTGGWYTATTKARINDWAGPFSVNSVGGTWQVWVKNPAYISWDETPGVPFHLAAGPFYDGITLDAKNPTAVLVEPAEAQAARQADAATKRAVAKYCKGITSERLGKLIEHARANGTGGDCWFCSMFKGSGGVDHLRQHLEEDYHMVSLYLNALDAAGYRDPGAVIGHADLVRRAVRRYLLAKLLVGPTAGRRAEADAVSSGF